MQSRRSGASAEKETKRCHRSSACCLTVRVWTKRHAHPNPCKPQHNIHSTDKQTVFIFLCNYLQTSNLFERKNVLQHCQKYSRRARKLSMFASDFYVICQVGDRSESEAPHIISSLQNMTGYWLPPLQSPSHDNARPLRVKTQRF